MNPPPKLPEGAAVPVNLNWHRGPANGGGGTAQHRCPEGHSSWWWDGDLLLIIVETQVGPSVHYVRVSADGDSLSFCNPESGDDEFGYYSEDIAWWAKINESLPEVARLNAPEPVTGEGCKCTTPTECAVHGCFESAPPPAGAKGGLHYVLAEQCDHSELWSFRALDTPEAREQATRSLLQWDDEEEMTKVLNRLREDGIAEFEGDPPIRWMDATGFENAITERELAEAKRERDDARTFAAYKDETATTFMNQVKKLQAENAKIRADLDSARTCKPVHVATIGDVWQIFWKGSGPIAPIIRESGLKIGDKLYALIPPTPSSEQEPVRETENGKESA